MIHAELIAHIGAVAVFIASKLLFPVHIGTAIKSTAVDIHLALNHLARGWRNWHRNSTRDRHVLDTCEVLVVDDDLLSHRMRTEGKMPLAIGCQKSWCLLFCAFVFFDGLRVVFAVLSYLATSMEDTKMHTLGSGCQSPA